MKKYTLNCLSVSGNGNRIYRSEDNEILAESHFPDDVAEELVKSGHLKRYTGKKMPKGYSEEIAKKEDNEKIEVKKANDALKERFLNCKTVEEIKKEFNVKELLNLLQVFDLKSERKTEDAYVEVLLSQNEKAKIAKEKSDTKAADENLKIKFGNCESVNEIKKHFTVEELARLTKLYELKSEGKKEDDYIAVLLSKNQKVRELKEYEDDLISRFEECKNHDQIEESFEYAELAALIKIYELTPANKSANDYITSLLTKVKPSD